MTSNLLKPEFIGWAVANGAFIAAASQVAFAWAGIKWYRSIFVAALVVAVLATTWSVSLNPIGTAIAVGAFVVVLILSLPLYKWLVSTDAK
ncbi:hypothetical protein [Gloeobacter kilaueensis]|uniref:hypothetical protein n=1 Tax=Gloeobacter kilaueensis TaxID=1416614 RepID=UPI0011828F8B|nr:hypothetical protein [Gloeobacter kilaueensis]